MRRDANQNNSLRQLLKTRGLSKKQQQEVVGSFDGKIYATNGHAGDNFIVTESSVGDASGVFVTRCSGGATPAERRKTLRFHQTIQQYSKVLLR